MLKVDKFDQMVGIIVEVDGGAGVLVETIAANTSRPTLTGLVFAGGCFQVGLVTSVQQPLNFTKVEMFCRGLPLQTPLHFRVLLRNHKSRAAVSAFETRMTHQKSKARSHGWPIY